MQTRVGIEAPSATVGLQDGRAPYLAHFGLSEPPFAITPDPRYLYMSAQHQDALAHLLYGVKEGGSFVQLTGEVGTGKTTLSRWLLEQTPPEVDVALVLNPRVTATELLAAVCDELKLAVPAGATAKGLVDVLYAHLLESHARGRRTLLIVDEAQDLEPEVLEQVRLLTNLETAKEKLLQVILIGQPELIRLLDQHGLRQLAQRITARYHLSPFPAGETASYIRHRLAVAGQGQKLFTRAAMRRIHRRARGIPRLINVICDRALLGAYAHDRETVDAATAERAAREVRGGPGPGERVGRWLASPRATAAAVAGGHRARIHRHRPGAGARRRAWRARVGRAPRPRRPRRCRDRAARGARRQCPGQRAGRPVRPDRPPHRVRPALPPLAGRRGRHRPGGRLRDRRRARARLHHRDRDLAEAPAPRRPGLLELDDGRGPRQYATLVGLGSGRRRSSSASAASPSRWSRSRRSGTAPSPFSGSRPGWRDAHQAGTAHPGRGVGASAAGRSGRRGPLRRRAAGARGRLPAAAVAHPGRHRGAGDGDPPEPGRARRLAATARRPRRPEGRARMSYILDALRKAERERRTRQTPRPDLATWSRPRLAGPGGPGCWWARCSRWWRWRRGSGGRRRPGRSRRP